MRKYSPKRTWVRDHPLYGSERKRIKVFILPETDLALKARSSYWWMKQACIQTLCWPSKRSIRRQLGRIKEYETNIRIS